MKLLKAFLSAVVFFSLLGNLSGQAPRNLSASEIELEIKKLRTTGSVLYIAAHPDDENTRLISWLANEKCVRTGYLSLTRGDGGQNLIGSEQGIELGVIRSQELLAARRTDGGEQFFTRAFDFGYSKTPKETFEKWDREAILSDMVFVIRNFRPDIIITRFATDGSGGHGHHTASALLAEEAFEAAANPKRFPEQLSTVRPWQAKRLLYNSAARFWNPNADMSGHLKVDVGTYNVLLGKSYGEIAAESRSMHRSQGFGSAKQRGEIFEYFKPIKGDTANLKDIFQGIDLSMRRLKSGKKLEDLLIELLQVWKQNDLDACNKLLKKAIGLCNSNDNDIPAYHREKLYRLLLHMYGIHLEATAEGAGTVAAGDSLKIKITALNRSNALVKLESIGVFLNGANLPACSPGAYNESKTQVLSTNKPFQNTIGFVTCSQAYPSTLYWLAQPVKDNKFVHLPSIEPWGLTTNYMVYFDINIGGESYQFPEILKYKWVDPDKGEQYRAHLIVPPVTLKLPSTVLILNGQTSKKMKVMLQAQKNNVSGTLHCGEKSYPFEIAKKNDFQEITIMLSAKDANEQTGELPLTLKVNGYQESKGIIYHEIRYDHIPVQGLFQVAAIKLVQTEIKKKLKKIGYIPGAGDQIPACLEQLGYEVVLIDDERLKKGKLSEFPTIITGVRAFNTNENLTLYKSKLMDYVRNGGNLIVQYNTNSFAGPFKGDIGPFPFKISRNRVTDEQAVVNIMEPQHPVLNVPNKIKEKDFDFWIQERSIYEATEIDSNYKQLFIMADAGEKPSTGSLITTKYGKGYFTYTGLVFFRQLPAGNAGAYKLFVNLIEQGKHVVKK